MATPETPPPGHEIATWSRCPTWTWSWAAFPPGETLTEWLEETGTTVADLARDSGLTVETVQGIVQASVALNPTTAGQLSKVTGVSAQFWLNLQHFANSGPGADQSG